MGFWMTKAEYEEKGLEVKEAWSPEKGLAIAAKMPGYLPTTWPSNDASLDTDNSKYYIFV